MRHIGKYTLLSDACMRIRLNAASGIWNGKDHTPYFVKCSWMIEQMPAIVIYTKENGYHTGGWWKNPDYERCWHLSISFPEGKDKIKLNHIIDNLFSINKNMLWVEPPFSEEGKRADVWHYRLFCDENWNAIIPRGEVYNTTFTEVGWKSFSES